MSTPLYGGWRRSRSFGWGSLNGRQTMMLLASVVAPLFTAMVFDVPTALWTLPAAVLLALGAVLTVHGVWVVDLAWAAIQFALARMRGRTVYRSQMWAPLPRGWDLPGVAAPTEVLELSQPGHGSSGLVWHKRQSTVTATYLLSPTGAILASQETVNRQVGAWGAVLAGLANDSSVSHATVTIDLTPAVGSPLPSHVGQRTDPESPVVARQIMDEVVQAAPTATTQIRARLSLATQNQISLRRPGKYRNRPLHQAVPETLRTLGGLSLHAAGVDVLRRASAEDLFRIVRSAYDPAVEQERESQHWGELYWHEVGPVAAEETWDAYFHDGVVSTTWCLVEAPRQQVPHHVLLPLLLPGPYPVRLSLLYRTLSREEAGSALKREQDAANVRRISNHQSGRDPSARDMEDEARAKKAAMEEAQGAGLTQFSLYVTTTAPSLEELVEARRHVEQAVGEARLRMRPCWGGQAAAFAVNLGVLGLYPPDL